MTLAQAVAHVTTTNPLYAVTQADIRGQRYKAFANIPGTTRALLQWSERPQAGFDDYLIFHDERWSYTAFCNDVRRTADALQEIGVTQGTPVGIAMRNCPELLILFMAITSMGAVAVFLNGWWTTPELDYALKDSAAKLVFADGERIRRITPLVEPLGLHLIGVRDGADAAPSFDAFKATGSHLNWPSQVIETDDDMAIMYSSGTTGHPKGVVLTHRGAMNAVFTWLMQGELAPLVAPPPPDAPPALRPCYLVVTPLFHVTASHPMFLLGLAAGGKLVVMDKWDADKAVDLIETLQVTRFLGVPTQSADLIHAAARKGAALSSLVFVGAGGAKRPAAQVEGLARAIPSAQIATGWGMTETNANGIGMAGPEYIARPGACGRLYPPVQELRFLDDQGHDVPPGEIGEITVRSPCNMRCYLNKPEATAETMQDGWLRTGDLGIIDAEGIVTIVDRKKNIIIRGGENIACLDVEGALHRHVAVAEACAFAIPDDRLGEVVGAAVTLHPDARVSEDELIGFLQNHIARFKVPERIWLHAGPLPRGTTDKLDRRSIRSACLEQLKETT